MKLTKKQKNCPYCRSKDPDANLEIYKDGDEYMSIGHSGDVRQFDNGGELLPISGEAVQVLPYVWATIK